MGIFTALEAFGDKLSETVSQRDLAVFDAAAERSGLPLATALEKLMVDEELLILAGLAVDAARRTRMQDKARLLGQSLGAILVDEALVDEESMWISIISRVEPPHVRLLGQFLLPANHSSNFDGQWRATADRMLGDAGYDAKLGVLVRPLAQDLVQLGLLEIIPEFLQRAGSIDTSIAWNATRVKAQATPLAPMLMMKLEDAGIAIP
ncbi:hypothetical protein ACX80I_01040 [Arthrobacter sp. MDT3-44]